MARRHQRPLIVIVPQIQVRLLQPKPAIVAHDPIPVPQNRGVAPSAFAAKAKCRPSARTRLRPH